MNQNLCVLLVINYNYTSDARTHKRQLFYLVLPSSLLIFLLFVSRCLGSLPCSQGGRRVSYPIQNNNRNNFCSPTCNSWRAVLNALTNLRVP